MQGVSRQWRDVLHHPSAHSLDTWDEDKWLRPRILTETEESGNSDISEGEEECTGVTMSDGFLRALVGYKVEYIPEGTTLAGLPPQLESLAVKWEYEEGWGWGDLECPGLPSLKLLDLSLFFGGFPSLESALFPRLEVLMIDAREPDYAEVRWQDYWDELRRDVEALPNLRSLVLTVYDKSPEFSGPSNCRVDLEMHILAKMTQYYEAAPFSLSEVPESLASHLEKVRIQFKGHPNNVLDLGTFSKCQFLKAIEVTISTEEFYYQLSPDPKKLRITGF